MPSNVKRKLAAIVFTDIAGFTKLSAVDEDCVAHDVRVADRQPEDLPPGGLCRERSPRDRT